MELADIVVPVVVFVFGYAIMALGRWMMRRPERLETVVWPDPKPVEKRDLNATKKMGSWLIFLGPFLSLMIVGITILAILPSLVRNNPIAFPLVLAAAAFAAYKLRQIMVLRQDKVINE